VKTCLTITVHLTGSIGRLGKKQSLRIEEASSIRCVLHVAARIITCAETGVYIGEATGGGNPLSIQEVYLLEEGLPRRAINADVTQIYATHYSSHF